LTMLAPPTVKESLSPPPPGRTEPKIEPPPRTRPQEAETTPKLPSPVIEKPMLSLRQEPISPRTSENPGNPSPVVVDDKARRIEDLLVKAEAAYDRGDILTSGGTSAVRYYEDVFAINDRETNAYKGIMRVIRKYLEWAGNGHKGGKVNGRIYLTKAQECLQAIPEALRREHETEIAQVNMEIDSLSSRLDHSAPGQKAPARKRGI